MSVVSSKQPLLNLLTAQVLPRSQPHVLSSVNFLPFAILHQVYDKTADYVFRCFGQIDVASYFLLHFVPVARFSKELGIGQQNVSFQREFSIGSSFFGPEGISHGDV